MILFVTTKCYRSTFWYGICNKHFPLALRYSQNSLTKFSVKYFNFGSQKDSNFLKGFSKLEELNIYNTHNTTKMTAFQYLPPLPSLQQLLIIDQKANDTFAKLDASTSVDSLKNVESKCCVYWFNVIVWKIYPYRPTPDVIAWLCSPLSFLPTGCGLPEAR